MRIFVGNLAFTTTEEELHRLFYGYGAVERAQIMTDRETGRPRGFAFVEMPNTAEAPAAIAGLNGISLGGRTVTVNEAREREARGSQRPTFGQSRRTRTPMPTGSPIPSSSSRPVRAPLSASARCLKKQHCCVRWRPRGNTTRRW